MHCSRRHTCLALHHTAPNSTHACCHRRCCRVGAKFRPSFVPEASDVIDASEDKFETAAHDTITAQQSDVTYGLLLRARPQVCVGGWGGGGGCAIRHRQCWLACVPACLWRVCLCVHFYVRLWPVLCRHAGRSPGAGAAATAAAAGRGGRGTGHRPRCCQAQVSVRCHATLLSAASCSCACPAQPTAFLPAWTLCLEPFSTATALYVV